MAAGIGTGKISQSTKGTWTLCVLEACSIDGERVEVGQVVEVGCFDALYLIGAGRAVQWSPSKVRAAC
jgi:hypothetical protein